MATLLPRLIRMRDAPSYLGMDRNKFNADVRPHLTEIPLGVQGIAFDRLDLDAWCDQYIARNGRAPEAKKGVTEWGTKECQASVVSTVSGTSRSASEALARFEKARSQVISRKPSGS